MKYLLFYVSAIHWIVSEILIASAESKLNYNLVYAYQKRTITDYFRWESIPIKYLAYWLPYASVIFIFTEDTYLPLQVTTPLCMVYAILRSTEHIDKNIIS